MPFVSTALLALAMSADAFAAAVGKGAALRRPRWRDALRIGLVFGMVEACTPLLGWWLGSLASQHVQEWDHWVAFTLLAVLGLRMVVHGLRAEAPDDGEAPPPVPRQSLPLLAVTGLATSIDAMAVGAGLAFIDADILSIAAATGVATAVMVVSGVMLGRVLGRWVGRRAEVLGGLVLIGIGCAILVEHLRMG